MLIVHRDLYIILCLCSGHRSELPSEQDLEETFDEVNPDRVQAFKTAGSLKSFDKNKVSIVSSFYSGRFVILSKITCKMILY